MEYVFNCRLKLILIDNSFKQRIGIILLQVSFGSGHSSLQISLYLLIINTFLLYHHRSKRYNIQHKRPDGGHGGHYPRSLALELLASFRNSRPSSSVRPRTPSLLNRTCGALHY